jgi:hypothetical protein
LANLSLDFINQIDQPMPRLGTKKCHFVAAPRLFAFPKRSIKQTAHRARDPPRHPKQPTDHVSMSSSVFSTCGFRFGLGCLNVF